ncbi:MAG: response regulator [Elusimicrobia bacterium]|nr:response regulator [Elusimicrobiota bacterium]
MEEILVVDDTAEVRLLFSLILKSGGYSVTEAHDAYKAMEEMKKKKFRVVIVDIVMPGMDGLELTLYIKKNYPDTEVIVSSTLKDKEIAYEALLNGACSYISKPFEKKELLVEVEKALQLFKLSEDSDQLESLLALHKASRAMISSAPLQEILDYILDVAVNTVGADGGSIMLAEEEGYLIVRSASGSMSTEAKGRRILIGERVSGRAMQERTSILVNKKLQEEDWFKSIVKYEKIYSGMSVPMIIKDSVLGVLNLKRTLMDKDFTERELMVTEILAADATIAISSSVDGK